MSLLRPFLISYAFIAPLLGTSFARAEDFTGFYAGVNAGYAFERGREERDGPSALPDPSANNDVTGLPPSALSASQSPAMRGARTERPPPR